jgi:hypothetical protein
MVWPITRRPLFIGSIHLTEAAFASQRTAALAGACRTEEHTLWRGRRGRGETSSRLVDYTQVINQPFSASSRSRKATMRNAEPNFPDMEKVNSLGPKSPLLIAFHSPDAPIETGLRMCPPEKSHVGESLCVEQSVLRSPGCVGIIAKYGHCSRISALSERNFFAVQTEWRREKDSNPQYRSETCKSRRLRRLDGINQFRNSPKTTCSPSDTLNSAVSRTS